MAAGGCESTPAGDGRGRRRIVSLGPAVTQMILALDAGDELVGVSGYCKSLPRRLPVVGDATSVNVEALLALRPTLVVAHISPDRLPRRLRELARRKRLKLLCIHLESLDDIYANLRLLGRHLDRARQAEQLIERIRKQLQQISAKVSNKPRVKVLFAANADHPLVAGSGTFIDQLIDIAGGRNVAESLTLWRSINKEVIIAMSPEVIIEAPADISPAAEAMLQRHRRYWMSLSSVPAVRHGRVYILPDASLTVPGVHVARTARVIAGCLHPELFEPPPAGLPPGGADR